MEPLPLVRGTLPEALAVGSAVAFAAAGTQDPMVVYPVGR